MVNSARKAGDFRVIYPRGVDRIDEVPWPLQDAINHALAVLAWYENYPADDLPCETLWDDTEAVEEHFEVIRLRREAEREGYRMSDDPEDSDMTQNDLASVFKQ